jgi:hypothetical protein
MCLGLPTLLWRSQHCCGDWDIVFWLPTLFLGVKPLFLDENHCFQGKDPEKNAEALFQGETRRKKPVRHCKKDSGGAAAYSG